VPVLTRGSAEAGHPADGRTGHPRARQVARVLAVVKPVFWLAAVGVAVTILAFLPRSTGTTWPEIGHTLSRVSFLDVVLLTVVWAVALFCYSFVLTGSLPGLRRRRAMTLNLTGSSVANIAPLGGAWGVGLNVVMLRRWGYAGKDIASFLMVSNVWNILGKLAVSGVVIGFVAVGGVAVPLSADGARAVIISALVAVLLIVIGLASERATALAGRVGDVVAAGPLRLLHLHRRTQLERRLPLVRQVMLNVVRDRWPAMSVGMVLYLIAQAGLLWLCLHMVGNRFTVAAVLTAFAVDRLLTAVPLTPGGSGVVEAGTAAALIALGGAPASVAAAVLLYRAFTFLAEIPVGGVWALGWFAVQRRIAAPAVPVGATGGAV
jgi:putative heme transporter